VPCIFGVATPGRAQKRKDFDARVGNLSVVGLQA